ncbi:hypothetical protein HOLleu_31406 [Holothuria leucospilota]|uniref:G-protein coupled receptor GRL101 n=1 Tax=Holothuria leucospilota TaxID=206669 RepID=A0A9Q0YRS9_HOLLE|nr:hypothetical protein HOLleu_31406 [Holothuria leucospilota]
MRVEFVGCKYQVCVDRLGMESGDITDEQISQASQQIPYMEGRFARLYGPRCWMPEEWGTHYYIQIDFKGLHTITGVITQGGRSEGSSVTGPVVAWADSFRFLYRSRIHWDTWKVYKDLRGRPVEFLTYPDPDTEIRHMLDRPVMTNGIRINPSGNFKNYCIRLEFLGCDVREKGHTCEGENTKYDGYCLRTVETQESNGCEEIFMEGSHPVVIQSSSLQKFFAKAKERLQLDFIYQYVIGLQKLTSHTQTSFRWLPETANLPMTYENFRWLPESILSNNTIEMCVYLDMDDSMKWRAFPCRDIIVTRATICQIDIDECLNESDKPCSHQCVNVAGSYHCTCPRGHYLTSLDGTLCLKRTLDYIEPLQPNFDYTDYSYTVPPLYDDDITPWSEFNSTTILYDQTQISTINTNNLSTINSAIPEEVYVKISSQQLAHIRCEELWKNVTHPVKRTNKRSGIIQGIGFPPWYNTGQRCEIHIEAPDGFFVTFTFHELRLRKSNSSAYCLDALNITDNFSGEGPRLRGSYCGTHKKMVVTSRSSKVTMTLAFGPLEADMPKKLGFIATYETTDCIGSGTHCEPSCGGREVFRNPTGFFEINSLKSNLAPFSFCNWTIHVDEDKYVALNFTEFSVSKDPISDACIDTVEILLVDNKEVNTNKQILCGGGKPYILTNASKVKIVFQTGLEAQSLGFTVNYESKGTPGCGIGTYSGEEPLGCTSPSAFIASINFPQYYPPNQNSTWHIRTEIGTYVELTFHQFDVAASRDCRADYIKVYEKEYEISRFCNSNLPPSPVRSSFNTLILAFVSDYTHEASGFLAEYRTARFEHSDTSATDAEPNEYLCPDSWLLFDGHCYKFMTDTEDNRWTDAQRHCDEESAFLVSINDVKEMDFVHATLISNWFSNNTKTYIGLQMDRSLGVHVWKDKTPLSYSDWSVPTHQNNWKMRQPNGGTMEECSLIDLTNLHSTNHWHDVPCASTDTSQYICEKPAERIGTNVWQKETIANLFTGACPSSMIFINGQCIAITPVKAPIHDLLLQNKTCQAGLSFVKEPLGSALEFYMDHISAYQGTLPILINVVNDVNGTACVILRLKSGQWKMRKSWCKDTLFGGAICAKPAEDQEQQCSSNLFRCSSNECIQKVQICDSRKDCADGSDETHCPTEADDSEFFKCGSGEKLQISFECDHNPQCLDGSDENDCAYPVCTRDQFTCRNGQCIAMDQRCDLVPHCVDGSDESDCEFSKVGFQCYDGKWIPQRAYCDGVKDCQGNNWEDEPQQCRPDQSNACRPEEIQCKSGSCEDRSTLCFYDFDQYGYQVGCRDVTHLRHCDMFECSNFTFKCPHSYCIPLHRRCDDRWDCPSGEDEFGCDNYTCPKGSYRCSGTRRCVSQTFVCDGINHCPSGDDEWLCGMACPPGCVCTGLSYSCHVITDNFISHIPSEVRRLNFSDIARSFDNVRKRSLGENNFSVYDTELSHQLHRFTLLKELDLSRSAITSIRPFMFQSQNNLRTLYLSGNKIEILMANSFAGLVRLAKLDISENPLKKIEPNAFLQLKRLPVLNLSGLLLNKIYPGIFTGLAAVQNISIRSNPIKVIETGSFVGLNKTIVLDVSDIGDGSIPRFELDVFHGLENLSVLVASNYVFCCLLGESTTCDAPLDQFSSCKDLMRYTFLRISMWLLGLSALLGNTFVLVWRWRTRQRESSKRVQTFLIINLAVADFLMGVYMITIAGADLFYRNRYMIHADEWKRSFLCQMSGLLSVLSSEASVFLLVLITIDRFLGVVFPFSILRFHTKSVRVVVACAWVLALFLSTLPLLIIQTPGAQFYGRSSVCLALPLTSDKPQGWMYSVILFVGVNFACFTLIFVCYSIMFVAIRNASRQSTRRREVSEEIKMATKMALIVGTDLFCWMPIIIMALLSWSGAAEIPQVDIYAVVAVFILPVNSAANPYLYTISTLDRSCEKTFRRGSMASPTPSSWKSDCTRDLSVNEMELVKVLRTNSIQPPVTNDKHMNGIMPAIVADLSESHLLPILTFRCRNILLSRLIARSDWHLKDSDVSSIENDLKKALDMLHRSGFLHGNINEDHVVIDQTTNANRTGAYLIMRGGEIETAEDTCDASEDSASDGEHSEGSVYDNQPTNIVDQEERISLIRRDWQQLKSLMQRLRTLC